ncbi:unnamed protein product [Urochloa humidicola]
MCNPATRRWVHLPLLSIESMYSRHTFLVFNPTVSRHYEVLVSPLDPAEEEEQESPADDTEWPPSQWTWHVFSSRTGQWRERVFVQEGEAAGIAPDMIMDFVWFISATLSTGEEYYMSIAAVNMFRGCLCQMVNTE